MLITGAHNRSATINLFAFEQQPQMIEPDEDWIEIDFHLKSEEQEWHVTDASLTAAEVRMLARWFDALAKNIATKKELFFWEPNLSFHLVYDYGKTKIILITFNAELKPDWFNEEGQYTMLVHLGIRHLKLLANELDSQLNDLYIKAGCVAQVSS